MLASIAGSLVGSDWALDDNEAGSGNALYPNFMARVRAEEANRATYGIRVLEDPHGLYTSAARLRWIRFAGRCDKRRCAASTMG